MKLRYITMLILAAGVVVTSCYNQEVAPVDSTADNPVVTITPGGDYSSVSEGDVLTFDITVNKMIQSPLSFEVVLDEGSTADADDIEWSAATLPAFASSTTLQVVVTGDGVADEGETLAFSIIPDFHWDWQIHPDSDKGPVSAAVKDLTYFLDWSTGSFAEESLCDSAKVDLDLYAINADQTQGDFSGATGACPVEAGNLGLPEDTYDIYVQYWSSDFPDDANASIPYVVTFSNGATVEGVFSSNDALETEHRVAQLVISGKTYTLYDANGTQLGNPL